MKRFALIFCLLLAACDDPQSTTEVLYEMGYTNIQTTGYTFFGCGEDDNFHTGFTATSPTGHRVKGVVCGGFLKGSTVRFF